ncbi:MAG: N-acetylglucosamine-6-phosphate deacetylase [Clostridia bacterium]|nr:N-acetylglucosamine-6-phosphate deacetylase [Clostridia bacterium]
MKLIKNARAVLPDRVLDGACVIYGKTIEEVASRLPEGDFEKVTDARGAFLLPGFVDVHIHGFLGCDFTFDGENEAIKIARALASYGVTSFLPTVMTAPKKRMFAAFDTLSPLVGKDTGGARIIGVNSEGPFISRAKKGAQDENGIIPFDSEFLGKYGDIIRLLTFAPELEGAEDFVRSVRKNTRVRLSVGHTACTALEARRALEAGADHFTHLFNAMSPLGHREPGAVGAALTSDAYAELICDGFHVDKTLFELVRRMKGEKLCLITDCIRPGGMPDGEYMLGGEISHKKGIECRLDNGTICGSVLTMDLALKNFLSNTSASLPEAAKAASENPARSIDERSVGRIERGYDSDMVLLDENLNVLKTIVKGMTVYEK